MTQRRGGVYTIPNGTTYCHSDTYCVDHTELMVTREGPDAEDPFRFEYANETLERSIAGIEKQRFFLAWKLVWGDIPPGWFHKDQRAVVDHKMICEKKWGANKMFCDGAPETVPTDFAARAIEPGNRSLGMFDRRLFDGCLNLHPIADPGDFSERHAGLRHPEGARVHSKEKNFSATIPVASDVLVVRAPGIIERVVDVAHWGAETEITDIPAKGSGDADQFFGVTHAGLSFERQLILGWGCRSRR